jgi:hypothetical protein
VQPENKGFGNPLQIQPNPLKKAIIYTQQQKAKSMEGFVPFDTKKNGQKWWNLGVNGFRDFGEK